MKMQVFFTFVFTISIFVNIVHAQDKPEENWNSFAKKNSNSVFQIYGRKLPNYTSDQFTKLYESLDLIQSHLFFSNRLPLEIGVLLDGKWTGAPGYFSPHLKSIRNEPSILIRPDVLFSSEQVLPLLTHELAHLIHFNSNPGDPQWQQEGFALILQYIVTEKLDPVMKSGFLFPGSSLTAVIDPHGNETDFHEKSSRASQYGHLLQYFYYLYRNCGESILEDFVFTPSTTPSLNSLERFFKRNLEVNSLPAFCKNFNSSFLAFEKARFLQNLLKENEYVHFSSLRATVYKNAKLAPTSLEPYSAVAYSKKAFSGCSQKSDVLLSASLCLRLRYE